MSADRMDVGQVGFVSEKEVRRVQVASVRTCGLCRAHKRKTDSEPLLLPLGSRLRSALGPQRLTSRSRRAFPPQRSNEIVNRLNKTKEERFPNLQQEREKMDQQVRGLTADIRMDSRTPQRIRGERKSR